MCPLCVNLKASTHSGLLSPSAQQGLFVYAPRVPNIGLYVAVIGLTLVMPFAGPTDPAERRVCDLRVITGLICEQPFSYVRNKDITL